MRRAAFVYQLRFMAAGTRSRGGAGARRDAGRLFNGPLFPLHALLSRSLLNKVPFVRFSDNSGFIIPSSAGVKVAADRLILHLCFTRVCYVASQHRCAKC